LCLRILTVILLYIMFVFVFRYRPADLVSVIEAR